MSSSYTLSDRMKDVPESWRNCLANLIIQAQDDIRQNTYVFNVNQTTNDKEITPCSSLKPLIMRSCSVILHLITLNLKSTDYFVCIFVVAYCIFICAIAYSLIV